MKRDQPITPDQALMLANGKGEIGYAAGGENIDWPAMQQLLDDGLIRYSRDDSYRDVVTGAFKSRRIYVLTEAGSLKRDQLKSA